MGRPLFSKSVVAQPTVRVEPEVTHPAYERWTYLNAFDPDSDEFFRDAQDEMPVVDGVTGTRAASPILVEVESISSSSSEASTSGRATPVEEEDEEEDDVLEINERAQRRLTLLRSGIEASAGETIRSNATNPLVGTQGELNSASSSEAADDAQIRPANVVSPVPIPTSQVAPEPVAIAGSRIAPIPIPVRPSTPPNQTAFYDGTPSPAPSVTPRIYAWSRPPMPSSPASPLPNRSARRSVAHIDELPSFPIRRVVV